MSVYGRPRGIGGPASASVAGSLSAADFAKLQFGNSGSPMWTFYSAIIDLTALGTYQVIPAGIAARFRRQSAFWEIKSSTACTVAPTWSAGSDAAFANNEAAQTAAAFTTQAAETFIATSQIAASGATAGDLTALGFAVKVTIAATATVLTARYAVVLSLLPI